MQATLYNSHQIHENISALAKDLEELTPSEMRTEDHQSSIDRLNYLTWCFKNSDASLFIQNELNSINQSISAAAQSKQHFRSNPVHVDQHISNALRIISNPRNTKLQRSDSAVLFRNLDTKLSEIESWKQLKETEAANIIETTTKRIDKICEEHENRYASWVNQGIEKFRKWRSILDKNIDKQQKYVNKRIHLSEESISSLETLFLTKLKLEAPTKYWEDKANRHRTIAWIASAVFTAIIIVALIAFTKIGWPAMHNIINELASKDNAGFAALLPVSLLLVPTLSVAWVLKHISRFIIQNFSLSEDADVRRNIALTFLAITKDKENIDAEMALVLQALFRPLDGSGHAEIPPPQLDEVIQMVKRK